MKNPRIVGIAHRRQAIAAPSGVIGEFIFATPVFEVEGRISRCYIETKKIWV